MGLTGKNFLTMKNICFVLLTTLILLSGCGGTKLFGVKFAIASDDEDLSVLSQVTNNDEPCIDPHGGDNGKNLFFAARENKKYYNIYKKENPFSSAMSQMTSGKNFNCEPAYNAATDRIAFHCQNEGNTTSDIYTIKATKGKAQTQITETSNAFEGNPCFSKDGKYIVYDKRSYDIVKTVSHSGINSSLRLIEKSEIWLKILETGESILLGNGYQPSFSPDDKRIAYVKFSADAQSCSIWIMDIDGGNASQITDAKKGYTYYPRWSPDGKRLVYQAASVERKKKDSDIYIIDIDGNNPTQLTKNKSFDGTPYWTTDGYIYFVSDRGNKAGNYQIWRFKITD